MRERSGLQGEGLGRPGLREVNDVLHCTYFSVHKKALCHVVLISQRATSFSREQPLLHFLVTRTSNLWLDWPIPSTNLSDLFNDVVT